MDPRVLADWLAIPATELSRVSPLPLTILPTKEAVYEHVAAAMFDELNGARDAGEPISMIIPIGPKAHYPMLAQRINETRLCLDHATFFGMDQWLDWQARPLAWEHPCNMEGYFHRHFLELIDPALRPLPENVIFPSPFELDRPAAEIARRGQVATTYGGFGFQGHLAFNEPPGSRWSPVSLNQLRGSTTHVVPVAVDTIIAHAERSLGGNVYGVPPMAITLGMRELLSARRIRLYTDGSSWKQTILRILLFSEPTVEFPVTLVHDHPDVAVVATAGAAACPSSEW